MKSVSGLTRSAQNSFAIVLSNEEPQEGINRAAFVLVYDKVGNPLKLDSIVPSTRGSNIFMLEGAGVAVAGYYYYDVEFDYTLGLNFYIPYKVDAKWTTIASGANITPTNMTAAYTTIGDGYSAADHTVYLGVRTNIASLNINNPVKAQRYSNTNRPSYVMRFDAPPANYVGDLWGGQLRVSVTVNGQNHAAAIFVAPNWAGTAKSSYMRLHY